MPFRLTPPAFVPNIGHMATARISRTQYDLLLEAFRARPGNYSHASQAAGVTVRTARRAWLRGWERPDWARPITSVFTQEQIGARARMEAQKADRAARLRAERDKARFDAEEERAREALAVRGSLNASLMLLGNIGQFSRVSQQLAKKAADDLARDIVEDRISWRDALKVQSQLALVAKRTSEQLEKSMEALRKHIGEPEKILGVASSTPTTEVDEGLAHDRLGEEGLKKAVMDLVMGRVDSPEASALIELQANQGEAVH